LDLNTGVSTFRTCRTTTGTSISEEESASPIGRIKTPTAIPEHLRHPAGASDPSSPFPGKFTSTTKKNPHSRQLDPGRIFHR
jgi:hypothetical protein